MQGRLPASPRQLPEQWTLLSRSSPHLSFLNSPTARQVPVSISHYLPPDPRLPRIRTLPRCGTLMFLTTHSLLLPNGILNGCRLTECAKTLPLMPLPGMWPPTAPSSVTDILARKVPETLRLIPAWSEHSWNWPARTTFLRLKHFKEEQKCAPLSLSEIEILQPRMVVRLRATRLT